MTVALVEFKCRTQPQVTYSSEGHEIHYKVIEYADGYEVVLHSMSDFQPADEKLLFHQGSQVIHAKEHTYVLDTCDCVYSGESDETIDHSICHKPYSKSM